MKKWLFAALPILVVCIIAAFFLIPSSLNVSVRTGIKCTINGANRVLLDETGWSRWWPSQEIQPARTDSIYRYNDFDYVVSEKLYNQFVIATSGKHRELEGKLILVQYSIDSLEVFWEYQLQTGNNPFSRVTGYLDARQLKNNAIEILAALKKHLEDTKNIYGFDIEHVGTPKTYLVATSQQFTQFPDVKNIYSMISKLSDYARKNDAKETGYPMLNVTRHDSSRYEAMVALPVDKNLPGTFDIDMRRIVTVKAAGIKVQGGEGTIRTALEQLDQYATDHRLFSPAIPYENLYTNRLLEPDTSKWITYVYLPLL